MIRKQIFDKSAEYVEIYSRSIPIEFRDPINGHVGKAFIAGAQWADRTILQEVLIWLDEHTYDEQYLLNTTPDAVGIAPYHTKEAMLRAFKERFNIE